MLDWGFGLGAFGMFFLYDWNRVFWRKSGLYRFLQQGTCCWLWWEEEWYMPASPQELRNNLYGSFLAHFFWLYWFIRCILHCPLIIHTARRRIGTRSAAQVCMAGAVIQASGGFLAAFSAWAYPPGIRTGWCSVFAFLCWTFCMPGIRTGLYL